jgi:7-keto-8-aminopelargonate synthetase-like enzyme
MKLGPQLTFIGRTGVLFEGRELTFFGGNDYHRLSSHPDVVQAFVVAAQRYGLSSAGSRVTTANHPLYAQLEQRLAEFLGTEAVALCPAGWTSNSILAQSVARDYAAIFVDENAHASLVEAAKLTGLPLHRFKHRDASDLSDLSDKLLEPGERPLVLTDGVSPNTGHTAPIAEYLELARQYGGDVLADDCHGVGVLGATGKGSCEEAGLPPQSVFVTGTLSKAFGCFGGIIAGSEAVIERVRSSGPGFIGSTPVPLPIAAAAIRAIELLTEQPERISLLRSRTLAFKSEVRALGFAVSETASPISSITYRDEEKNRALYDLLLLRGLYPPFIDYPGSPPGGHFRFTLSSEHSDEQIANLLGALRSSRAAENTQ